MASSQTAALDLVSVHAGAITVQYLRQQLNAAHLRGTPLASLSTACNELRLDCPPQVFLNYVSPFVRYVFKPNWKELQLPEEKEKSIKVALKSAGFNCLVASDVEA